MEIKICAINVDCYSRHHRCSVDVKLLLLPHQNESRFAVNMSVYITIAVFSIGDKADFYVYFPLHLCAVAKDFNFQTVSNIPQRIFLLVVHASHAFCFTFYCHSKKQQPKNKKGRRKGKEKGIFMYDEMSILHVSNCPQQHPFLLLILNNEELTI